MSATQQEHVIQVPDTPAFEGEIAGGVPDDPADEPSIGWCCKVAQCVVGALVVASFAFLVAVITLALLDGPRTEYSAAITGAAAAGASSKAAASPNAIPPLFKLTVHIKNPKRLYPYCVPSGTTAAVTHDGAAIGAGTVPMFCAGTREEGEVVVPVWAVGAGADDVTLPLELQRREAVVDVVIQMPRARGDEYVRPHLVACSVRPGHGLSPCTASDYY